MDTALRILGQATLLLVGVAAVLALLILILVEAHHTVRLSAHLRSYWQRMWRDQGR
jgi:hypothetical protein